MVTLEGRPVVGVEIVRTAEISDKVHTDKSVTDENGVFYFEPIFINSLKKILPMELVITQKMVLSHRGSEYLGWRTGKQDSEMNTELDDDRPLDLVCDLANAPIKKDQKNRLPVVGICTWN